MYIRRYWLEALQKKKHFHLLGRLLGITLPRTPWPAHPGQQSGERERTIGKKAGGGGGGKKYFAKKL
jgi:hypothetical protein